METYFKDIDLFIHDIKQHTQVAYFNRNKRELVCGCPFPDCEIDGLNNSDLDHGHLHINLFNPIFKCFKCDESGHIVQLCNFLKLDIKKYIHEDRLTFKKSTKKFSFKVKEQKFKIEHTNLKTNLLETKKEYLKNRLPRVVDVEKIPNIIFDIKSFVKNNNFAINDEDVSKLDFFNENYIGFLTTYQSKMILRSINDKNLRYRKIKLEEIEDLKDFYGFQIKEPDYTKTNIILLAEGPFDILSAYKNPLMKKMIEKVIFCASVLGNSFDSVLKPILNLLGLINAEVMILSDRNIQLNDNRYKKVFYNPLVDGLSIFYNSKGKDFGEVDVLPVKYSIQRKHFRRSKR